MSLSFLPFTNPSEIKYTLSAFYFSLSISIFLTCSFESISQTDILKDPFYKYLFKIILPQNPNNRIFQSGSEYVDWKSMEM